MQNNSCEVRTKCRSKLCWLKLWKINFLSSFDENFPFAVIRSKKENSNLNDNSPSSKMFLPIVRFSCKCWEETECEEQEQFAFWNKKKKARHVLHFVASSFSDWQQYRRSVDHQSAPCWEGFKTVFTSAGRKFNYYFPIPTICSSRAARTCEPRGLRAPRGYWLPPPHIISISICSTFRSFDFKIARSLAKCFPLGQYSQLGLSVTLNLNIFHRL